MNAIILFPRRASFLRAVRDLIATPATWCQGVYAKNYWGRSADFSLDSAKRFCLLGACLRVQYKQNLPFIEPQRRELEAVIADVVRSAGSVRLAVFNDGARHSDVVMVLDLAIGRVEL